jgi:YD repeat-containing protein
MFRCIDPKLYDNAGQLLKIQKAVGVTTANGFAKTLQQDYVTYTYTNNGKQQFVTDANGNKAQYTWDGFDRLSKWSFPSPTTPGTVSTTDYEQYTYDPAGNRLSLRRRDGRTLTFAYDNFNRMLSKLIPDGCPPIQPTGQGFSRRGYWSPALSARMVRPRSPTSAKPPVTAIFSG